MVIFQNVTLFRVLKGEQIQMARIDLPLFLMGFGIKTPFQKNGLDLKSRSFWKT